MTDADLDAAVARTRPRTPSLAPSDLDPRLVERIIAERRPSARPAWSVPTLDRRRLWPPLAVAAATALVLIVVAAVVGLGGTPPPPAQGGVPRYLMEPPWRVEAGEAYVRLDIGPVGTTRFSGLEGEFASLDWGPADEHEERMAVYTESTIVNEWSAVDLDGRPASIFLSETSRTVWLAWVEGEFSFIFRYTPSFTQQSWADVQADDVFDVLVAVDEAQWQAALPGDFARGRQLGMSEADQESDATVSAVLTGVPLPPDLDLGGSYGVEGDWLRGPLAALAVTAVTCGWLDAWEAALASGDEEGARRAAAQLVAHDQWPVIAELPEGTPIVADLRRIAAAGTDASVAPQRPESCS